MSRDGINHHLAMQKMVVKSAMEDDENKIRAMKAVAESGSNILSFPLLHTMPRHLLRIKSYIDCVFTFRLPMLSRFIGF